MRVLYNQRRCDDTHNSFSLAHSRISSNRKFGFISTDRSEQKKFTRFCFTDCDDTHNSFNLAHSRISSNRKFGFISTDRSEQKKFTRFCFTEIKTLD